jgi:hypothetical protein
MTVTGRCYLFAADGLHLFVHGCSRFVRVLIINLAKIKCQIIHLFHAIQPFLSFCLVGPPAAFFPTPPWTQSRYKLHLNELLSPFAA